MNGDIREPEPADDDIPVLTDIVVPGRLHPAAAASGDAPQTAAQSAFDGDLELPDSPGRSGHDPDGVTHAHEPIPGAVADAREGGHADPAVGDDIELPLPWADTAPASTAPWARQGRAEPLIVAATAKAAATTFEPPDADAQLLLRELRAEIGKGLERRLAQEMAQTELRLRAALNEELDTRLRELLAGTSPLR